MKNLFLILLLFLVSCSNTKKESNYFFIKGLNEYEKNNKVKALENYKKAYEIDKENLKVMRELGYIYSELGNLEEAKNFYKKVLDLEPYDENALENILKILYIQKNIEDIEKYSEQILDKNSLLYKHSQIKIKNLKRNGE